MQCAPAFSSAALALIYLCLSAFGCVAQPSGQRSGDPTANDRCVSILPSDARSAIETAYPGYRLPHLSDSAKEDIDWDISNGGTGCLLVTSGKFDSDQSIDYATVVRSKNKDEDVVIIAARNASNRWMVERLDSWNEGKRRLFVRRLEPGSYGRETGGTDQGEGGAEGGTYTASVDGVELGVLESVSWGFFFDGNKWIKVLLAD